MLSKSREVNDFPYLVNDENIKYRIYFLIELEIGL